jgi:tRNA (guanine37-N1)-methyltransferase
VRKGSSFTIMHIDIISIVPQLLESPFAHSIMKRAEQKGLLNVNLIDLRPYGFGKHKQVDDYQFGGGAGMVLMVEPLMQCINELKKNRTYDEVIYVTPDGETLNQKTCNTLSLKNNILIICGHYKGIDERVRQLAVTREISIGDYVLSGGELAAAILVDSIGRLIPGVLNDETSALTDSFQDGLLSPPVYTRPLVYEGLTVPDILTSGNHIKISQWRQEQSLARTQERRPDLLQ